MEKLTQSLQKDLALAELETKVRTLTEALSQAKEALESKTGEVERLDKIIEMVTLHHEEPRCVICRRFPDPQEIMAGGRRWYQMPGSVILTGTGTERDSYLVFCPTDWDTLNLGAEAHEPGPDASPEERSAFDQKIDAARRIIEIAMTVGYERGFDLQSLANSLGVSVMVVGDGDPSNVDEILVVPNLQGAEDTDYEPNPDAPLFSQEDLDELAEVKEAVAAAQAEAKAEGK